MNVANFGRQAASENWGTPQWISDKYIGGLYRDVVPYPRADGYDALTEDWPAYAYCNPPYNNIQTFVEKAISERTRGVETLMLLPVRTSTRYWQEHLLYKKGVDILFLPKRLKYISLDGHSRSSTAPFDSALITIYPLSHLNCEFCPHCRRPFNQDDDDNDV